MTSARNKLPAPTLFPGDEPFWEAARQGQLMAKQCPQCGRLHYYPRLHCPHCGHAKTEWKPLCGRGTLYSFSIVERASRPTAPAIVELEEGLRIHSVVADADVHRLRIGEAVSLRFLDTQDGPPVPCFTTPAADAARHYTRQSRQALQLDALGNDATCQRAAVIGSGHMGTGISLALLNAGCDVVLVDASQEALAGARKRIEEALEQEVKKGRIGFGEAQERIGRLHTNCDMEAMADAQVVIEAVWEDPAVKREVFAQIDRHAAPHALLATNTSTLDVADIARATNRPGAVVGLHFFNPAHVMRLIEVVRSPLTSDATLRAAKALAVQLGKTPIVVGICDGFVGNRLMITRERQAGRLLLEGALPDQIDRFLREFGLPMGTFELQDMAGGIALTHRARQRAGQKDWLIEQLFSLGRLGLRAGQGYYRYEAGKRRPIVDPQVTRLIEEASCLGGITRRKISDQELHDRLILPMINEGAKLVEEDIVERASDIDLVWQLGYGWPDWKGGPMHYADQLGAARIVERLRQLQAQHGDVFRPAELLIELAASGQSLSAQKRTPQP